MKISYEELSAFLIITKQQLQFCLCMKLKRFVESFVLQAEIKQKSITFCDFAVKQHYRFCDFCNRIISVKTKFDFCYVKTNEKDRSQSGLFRFTLNCTRTFATTNNSCTRLLTGSPCPAAGGRKRGAVSRKKYRVQRPPQGQLHDNISDRSQVRALFEAPCLGNNNQTQRKPLNYQGFSCFLWAIFMVEFQSNFFTTNRS